MFKSWEKSCKHALSENNKNKIKRKRGKSRKQTEFHLNIKYKFVSNNNFKKNAN